MIKLTKNEIYKIFHKKLIYIMTAIVVVVSLLFCVLDSLLGTSTYDSKIDSYQNTVSVLESSGDTTSSDYISNKTQLDTLKLLKEKNIKEKTPEEYYIQYNINQLYYEYYSAVANKADETIINKSKTKLDEAIKKLDNFDWKDVIKEEIEELKAEPCSDDKCELVKQESIRVAEYKLNHNMPNTSNAASNALVKYINVYREYLNIKDSNEEIMSHDALYSKKLTEKEYNELKYMLDNELLTNDYDDNGLGTTLVDNLSNPNFTILIVLLIISSTIVAEEFNKGTIKQLLVKPYSRTKIIISKMIATLISVIVFVLIFNISSILIEGIYYGTLGNIFQNHIIYDFNTHSCITMTYIKEGFIAFVHSLPMIILLGIFVFAMATLTTNTAFALGLGFGAYLSGSVFEMLIPKFKILSYVPTVNYNLAPYMFGNINYTEGLTLTKALTVDIISFIVLFIFIIIVFNKKEVKNQ